ncbi:amino acid permease [Plectosphaerella plurivora]|uniref:Amino acid permease n=1 Tax=Plectosphaerella plurivora TaxID=936078 RepID=A0A9P9AEN8_9PEZI|nr:amino acid permease [Plectosphaerella plurivora]
MARTSSEQIVTASKEVSADGLSSDSAQQTHNVVVHLAGPSGESDKLQRDISRRHMIFIALGGSIGAGLFVGSGGALAAGGPMSLVLNFALVGFGVTCTMGALGELAAAFPVAGSFYTYATMFVSEAWGFTMGWNFVFNWLIIFPFELTCIASQIRFWKEDIHPAIIVTPILFGLILTSFAGSKWYGEIEHAFGIAKAMAISVFIILAFLIIGGGVSSDPRQGTGDMYWRDGQAFRNGFVGFMFVFRTAGMSYGGTELLGMTAAECKNPRRLLPLATKITFVRILVFYVLALLLLGFCVSAADPNLAMSGHGAKISPFTLAARLAGVKGLAIFFNILIVVALLSMANASIYASSRAFQALCDQGMGPRMGARIVRGVPVWAFALSFLFGLLAYVELAPGGQAIFDWLLSLSGACNYYTWISICVSHICFRRSWRAQGRSTDDLLWKSPFGVWGSCVGIVICAIGLLANIVTAIWPINGKHDAGAIMRDNVGTVIPLIVLGGFVLWSRYKRPGTPTPLIMSPDKVDLSRVRLASDVAEEPEQAAQKSRV